MRLETFEPYHIDLLKAQGVQGAQLHEVSLVPASYARLLAPAGPCFTVFHGERVTMCAGVAIAPGFSMGIVWAVISDSAAAHMLALHRGTLRFFETQRLRRLEATIEKGFKPGCRWAELLGFKYEGEMPGYGIDGQTHLRYGRVT